MERVLNVITLDIKRKKFLISLIVTLAMLSLILFFNYITLNSYGMCEIKEVPSLLLRFIPFIILVVSSFSLTQEFANKTDKIIFTGIFSRNEIVISKLMNFIVTSIIFFMFYEVICSICGIFDSKLLLNNFSVFIIYTFTLGSFILLVSTITSNFIITGIVGYVLYFDLILVLLNQALASNASAIIKRIIENSPFYIANTGFYIGNYTMHQLIIMITCGILFLVSACVIINKKNM